MKVGGSMRAERDKDRKETQKQAILRLCKDQAYTIQELCDEMNGANYWAVGRVVKDLVENKLIEELPFRQNRSILYQATGKIDHGVIKVQVGEALIPLSKITQLQTINLRHQLKVALCYVWRRSYLKTQGEEGRLAQSYILPVEAKKDVEAVRGMLKRTLAVTEQILMADIWADQEGDHEKFGLVTTEEVVEILASAELYMKAKEKS